MTEFSDIEKIKQILLTLLEKIGFPEAGVGYEESITRGLVFNISLRQPFLLIGHRGSVLHSLEILAQAMVAKAFLGKAPVYFKIDVDDYQIKREWFLKETAKEAAVYVKKTGKATRLEPMPAYERRFVHAYLQEHNSDLFTESQGTEPYRRIVIRKK